MGDKMSTIDLHIHSNISLDGTHSVEKILQMAKDNKMEAIAITDHNSVRAVEKAIQLGKEVGIQVIPGIEIDCVYQNINFHMTAYNINYKDPRYKELEEFYLNDSRVNTWKATRKFLNETNINISEEILNQIAIQGVLVPEDICEYLLTHEEFNDLEILKPYRLGGNRSDNPNVNFYWDYFSQGKIAYFKEEKKDVFEMIQLVHDTGGKCFVAHPKANFNGKNEILESLLNYVDGLEVFSSYHSEEDCQKYLEMAQKHKLKITCGSDFHGIHKPNIKIGKIPGNKITQYIQI